MTRWSLPGIIITLVVVLVLVGVVSAFVVIDPVFIETAQTGTEIVNASGVYGDNVGAAPTSLLAIIVGNVADFFASGVQSLFRHVFWNW